MPEKSFPQTILKMPTGIEGLDSISRGGLPRERTTVLFGRPGSGKTVFALQTLVNGIAKGENGILVTFEESAEAIKKNAATFGWDLEGELKNRLEIIDARFLPQSFTSGEFDTIGLLAGLKAKAKEINAKRIVLDSVDTLLFLLQDDLAQRRELYRLLYWTGENNITSLMTIRQISVDPFTGNFHFLHYMADCAIALNYRISHGISSRSLRFLKYRGSGFAENEFPFLISENGIRIGSLGAEFNQFTEVENSQHRLTTGIEALDEMLDGGLFEYSSTLITGHPGTGKSTLCSAFVQAHAALGKKSLLISFDETRADIIRNMSSINLPLQPLIDSDKLVIKSILSGAHSSEEYFLMLETLIREHSPNCVAIDPLSAIVKGQEEYEVNQVAKRLLHMTKSNGITLICSSLMDRENPSELNTPIEISTIADTWLHLEYITGSGERNRSITVIKSRGTAHSNQMRELVFTEKGISLAEACIENDEVLMGTRRIIKEREGGYQFNQTMKKLANQEQKEKFNQDRLQAKMLELQKEMEETQFEINQLRKERQSWKKHQEEQARLQRSSSPQSLKNGNEQESDQGEPE